MSDYREDSELYGGYGYVDGQPIIPSTVKPSALATQVGGDHYVKRKIQPIEFIHANKLDFNEGNIVKYITRWRDKGGLRDLNKIKDYVDLIIELEGLE